ncbi:hypothetical protein GCM10023323_17300 [Streptomyces thinghirensis]|uniref:Orc1-like AAA ATPase domain-containing protein n=2 Tax=Streptomyces thinghirensis TaxID=551547 RepID=A0ABP9SY67_9ACTN
MPSEDRVLEEVTQPGQEMAAVPVRECGEKLVDLRAVRALRLAGRLPPSAPTLLRHSAILRGEDDRLLPGSPLIPPASGVHRPPAHLPPGSVDFTGRCAELRALTEGLTARASAVQVVAGPGGSGKSALAVHAAHQVAAHFKDGQLFAELRGMSDSPATTEETLGGFLRALGVPDGLLPPAPRPGGSSTAPCSRSGTC